MVSGLKRNPSFPDIPSAGELGLPDYTVTDHVVNGVTAATTDTDDLDDGLRLFCIN